MYRQGRRLWQFEWSFGLNFPVTTAREDPGRILGRHPGPYYTAGMFAYYTPWVLTSSLEGVVRYGAMRSCTGSLGVCVLCKHRPLVSVRFRIWPDSFNHEIIRENIGTPVTTNAERCIWLLRI